MKDSSLHMNSLVPKCERTPVCTRVRSCVFNVLKYGLKRIVLNGSFRSLRNMGIMIL